MRVRLLLVIIVFESIASCMFVVRVPDKPLPPSLDRKATPTPTSYSLKIDGALNREGAVLGLETAANSAGFTLVPEGGASLSTLWVGISHYHPGREGPVSLGLFTLSAFSLFILPAKMQDSDILAVFQFRYPDGRVFTKSYSMIQYYWGTGLLLLLNQELDSAKTKEIVERLSLQFFDDLRGAEESTHLIPMYRYLRLKDGRVFYAVTVQHSGEDAIITVPGRKAMKVPRYAVVEMVPFLSAPSIIEDNSEL